MRRRRRKEAVQGRTSMGRFHPGVGPPNAICAFGNPWQPSERTFPSAVKRRFMAGKTSDRPSAEGFATGSTAASGIIHRQPASSAYGRSDVVPPMNRRNPAPRRMARYYGSCCGARGRDYPLNRLFSWSGGQVNRSSSDSRPTPGASRRRRNWSGTTTRFSHRAAKPRRGRDIRCRLCVPVPPCEDIRWFEFSVRGCQFPVR